MQQSTAKGLRPSGSLPFNRFIEEACKNNSLAAAYAVIRERLPVSFRQVRIARVRVLRKKGGADGR